MDKVGEALLAYGGWGLLFLALIFVVTNIEKVEKVSGHLLGLFAWANRGIRRRSICTTIQGQINEFSRSVDGQAKGLMPYNMRLEFIKQIDRAELMSDQPLVIVRIRDRKDEDKNLVHAMLAFCPAGLIPQARPYLSKSLSLAVDLTVTRKLLNRVKRYSALQYLYGSVLPLQKKELSDLDNLCSRFDYLDERGLFTRVILHEFRDFGASVESSYPRPEHASEARNFLDYVYAIATRAPGQEMTKLGYTGGGYRGKYISTAFVLIGTWDRITSEGTTPYLKHLRYLRTLQFRRAILTARDTNIDTANRVSYLAEKAGIAQRRISREYDAKDTSGWVRKNILIQMDIHPLAPGEPPQGRLFDE